MLSYVLSCIQNYHYLEKGYNVHLYKTREYALLFIQIWNRRRSKSAQMFWVRAYETKLYNMIDRDLNYITHGNSSEHWLWKNRWYQHHWFGSWTVPILLLLTQADAIIRPFMSPFMLLLLLLIYNVTNIAYTNMNVQASLQKWLNQFWHMTLNHVLYTKIDVKPRMVFRRSERYIINVHYHIHAFIFSPIVVTVD